MSLGRTSRKMKRKIKKHARKHYARKPYKRKKVALRKRQPGKARITTQKPAHKVTDIPVYVQRNPNAGKDKNAFEVCAAIPGRKAAGGEQYACASGKNPRSAMAKSLRAAASVIGKRTGTFAGI